MSDFVKSFLQKLSISAEGTKSFLPTKTVISDRPRLFALVIGIDFYEHVRSLRCAVADALSFKDYFEHRLNVPSAQISTLINKSASRVAIIEALRSFRIDSRIQTGDPIVIFFAGHGAEIPTSTGGVGAKMQTLVPQDYCEILGKEVASIPDRTFGALIDSIAEEKGDNITVIFDCCHAASGTRGDDNIRFRSIEVDPKFRHPDTENDIPEIAARSLSVTPGFLKRGLRSHVLLAACSSSELSAESQEHGRFTSALLKLLKFISPDEITYEDVLSRMDAIPSQNPQCEGLNHKRYLFNGKVSKPARSFYPVRFEGDQIIMEAGAVHGVVRGAEFSLFKDESFLNGAPIAILAVDTVQAFSASLRPRAGEPLYPSDLKPDLIAVQTKAGEREDLRLYIPPEDNFLPCYNAWLSLMQGKKNGAQNITLLDAPEDAHIELAMENGRIMFLFRDDRITQYGLKQAYFDVAPNVDEISHVLKSAAHYFWKLNLTNNNPEVTSCIQTEFYQLDPSDDDFDDDTGMPEMTPILPNICRNNVIDFVIDDGAPYGIKLTNNSPYDFYPFLFYFDNSDFSIAEYYQPPKGGPYKPDVPLKANGGTLTIGYGSGGIPPFSYFLRDRQNVDVGFLKLFICTRDIDLSIMSQPSPFADVRGSLPENPKDAEETWGTILLPVIQRRYPPTPETHCVQCGTLTSKSLELHYLSTIHDLEAQRQALEKELDIMRHMAKDHIDRLQGEVSDLRAKLETIAKEDSGAANQNIKIENSEHEITSPEVEAPNGIVHSKFKRIIHAFKTFRCAKAFQF